MAAVVSQDSPGRGEADLKAVVAAVNDPQPAVIAIVVTGLVAAVVLTSFNLYWLMVLDPFLARRNPPERGSRHAEGADAPSPSPDRAQPGRDRRPGLAPLRVLAPPPERRRRHPQPRRERDPG